MPLNGLGPGVAHLLMEEKKEDSCGRLKRINLLAKTEKYSSIGVDLIETIGLSLQIKNTVQAVRGGLDAPCRWKKQARVWIMHEPCWSSQATKECFSN